MQAVCAMRLQTKLIAVCKSAPNLKAKNLTALSWKLDVMVCCVTVVTGWTQANSPPMVRLLLAYVDDFDLHQLVLRAFACPLQ
jgi:glycerol uptake facilitator-like aquaporin